MRVVTALSALVIATFALAGCSSPSPAAQWQTGKDILDSLKEAGFTCEWTGSGEQVMAGNPLTPGGPPLPTVRCDGYGIALIAAASECKPIPAEAADSADLKLPLVLGDNFVIIPGGEDGAFPGAAQPQDFIKAFGGEETTLLGLAELACPSLQTAPSSSASGTAEATGSDTPAKGMVNVDGTEVPGLSFGMAGPTLELWADPQSPAVAALNTAAQQVIKDVVSSGKATVVIHPVTFLDANLANGASTRAVAALGCALDEGKALEYWSALLDQQPAQEGDGWTDEELVAIGRQVNLSESSDECITSHKYADWATASNDLFMAKGIVGVPYATLNGTEVPTATLTDKAALTALLESNT